MAVKIWNLKCGYCNAPCAGGFKKCVRLPSGIDIYEYGKINQSVQTGESDSDNDNTFVFHHKRYEGVNRQTVISELNKYITKCSACRCIVKRVRNLLEELNLAHIKDVFAICEHCRKSTGSPCKRCEYVLKKFQCCNNQLAERQRRFKDWISQIKGSLQGILDTSHAKMDLLTNADDLLELERLLRDIYPEADTRTTPNIEDCCNTSESLTKLYENREILRKILERMKDESGWMTRHEDVPRVLGEARVSRTPSHSPKRLALPPPPPPPTEQTHASSRKIVKNVPIKRNVIKRSKGAEKRKTDQDKKKPPETIRGIFTYQLSDKKFIDNGWTRLPILETKRVYDIYKMLPVNDHFGHEDWIALNRDKGVLYYDSGDILAIFKENGSVTWYYRNGMVALVYNRPDETRDSTCMYILYGFEVDTRKKQSILAKFNYRGNGVVYDSQGNERLKYNQTFGEIFDKKLGSPSHWLWHDLNEPPEYETMFKDTYEKKPDPRLTEIIQKQEITDKKGKQQNQEEDRMLEIEWQNRVKSVQDKRKKNFKTYYLIKKKTLRINEYFILDLFHQTQITLRFNDGGNRFNLDLGLVIHRGEYLGRDFALISSEITPKICRPEFSWSMIPKPLVPTMETKDSFDCFNSLTTNKRETRYFNGKRTPFSNVVNYN